MKDTSGYKDAMRSAFPYTLPVLAGYLFMGLAFGVMFEEQGYSVLWAIIVSVFVYAGSGQYLALNFFVPGYSFIQAIALTLMVNIRHVFYGLSLVERYNRFGWKRWYLIFGMTDETYSLACTVNVPEDVDEEKFVKKILSLPNKLKGYKASGLAYGLSKKFVIWYAAKSAFALGAKGIRVCSLSPGLIATDMGNLEAEEGASLLNTTAEKRMGKPEELGFAIASVADERNGYLAGVDVLVDGGSVVGKAFVK